MSDFPAPAGRTNLVEPSPRRIRGVLDGRYLFDTTRARYVWELAYYPQYYVPVADLDTGVLTAGSERRDTEQGPATVHGLPGHPGSVLVFGDDAVDGVRGYARVAFDALDAWYEEDEPIVIHPRNPYTRCDAVRSHRHVRVSLDGVPLADGTSTVFLFETGLPTRYYFDRTDVDFTHLVPSDTVTGCPYKGRTSGYWSVRLGDDVRPDLAWTYDAPLRDVLPLAGLVAFYNEKVDIEVDGVALARPATKFS